MEQFLSPTTERHNWLASRFMYSVFPLLEKKEVYAVQEQIGLVHFGKKREKYNLFLIDVELEVTDEDKFIHKILNDLECVYPDFMLFTNNKYIKNTTNTKIAGIPNLIVEIWSDGNSDFDRDLKFELYSGKNTEHWYINQDSNNVDCWFGNQKLKRQLLTNILVTKQGFTFDLRFLAL